MAWAAAAANPGNASAGASAVSSPMSLTGGPVPVVPAPAAAPRAPAAPRELAEPGEAWDDLGLVLSCALSTGSAWAAAASASIATIPAAAEIIFAAGLEDGDAI